MPSNCLELPLANERFVACGVAWRLMDNHGHIYAATVGGKDLLMTHYPGGVPGFTWWLYGVGYKDAHEATREHLETRRRKLRFELDEVDRCLAS
jgi:hypothetical protein